MNSFAFPDRFTRTVDLYGVDGFSRIRSADVTVFGQGGVGAHAAVALARGGVGRLTVVDFDVVSVSSLNRHACAGPDDVGRPKADVMAEFLGRTCPDTEIVAVTAFFHHDSADALLAPAPCHVVDAIDSLNPKIALLVSCLERGIPVASSMGAASRTDVNHVRAGDIAETSVCPLAARVRRFLRRQGYRSGVPCVWSTEPPAIEPMPANEPRLIDRGRERQRLASSMCIPGVFGFAVASLVLGSLAAGEADDPAS